VKLLVETLKRVSRLDGVVLLHLLTEKGKGHPKAPDHPERVHAVKGEKKRPPVSPREDEPPPSTPKSVAWTKAFAQALIRVAERDLRVQAITAAMPSGTGLDAFEERFPARFYDTGITEQHAVAMSAGMAKGGLRPVAAIYSTFLQRAYDQVFQEVALQNLPVLFCMDRAGLVGQDGPTHNGVFDIAYLRTLPNFTLCSPRDATDLGRMIEMALAMTSPVSLRYPRGECPVEETIHVSERRRMEPGTAEVLAEGDRVVIWAYGALVSVALETAERLRARGVAIGVVDARFAKPLDEEMLARDLARYRTIVTLEEHQRAGGFGSAVLEAASRLPVVASGEGVARVKVLAVPDRFIEHKSTREEQLHEVGLDADGVERTIRTLLSPSLV
jgi:1-deoxy-D-xylulose-5-phosphate synthase